MNPNLIFFCLGGGSGVGGGGLEYVNYFYKESRSKKSLNFLTKNPNLFKFFFFGGGALGVGRRVWGEGGSRVSVFFLFFFNKASKSENNFSFFSGGGGGWGG